MRLTPTERTQITAGRKRIAAEQRAIKLARGALSQLTDRQVIEIAKQLESERRRVTGPRPCCTCDQQSSDPNCPAARAGYSVGAGMECSIRPPAVAWVKVTL